MSNVTIVADHWQQRCVELTLLPHINTEHEAGQATSTVFHVFGKTPLWFEPTYQLQ